MWLFPKKLSVKTLVCLIILLLLIPFDTNKMSLLGSETTIYKAALYSIVRVDVMGLKRTKFYFFPSKFDANNNFEVMTSQFKELNEAVGEFMRMGNVKNGP